ncbi:MAG TPA: sigma-70 family RNA polymerase sigma factor [Firmicutes bacterium]|nr:sigma-70 family RNA polymerase sigma factor [Bacillota bacterium]
MEEEKRKRDEQIKENMGLVYACAARLRDKGVEYDELVQAGCVGLILACDRFDPGRGFRFSTYAVPLILGEMRRLFREGGSVRVSRRMRDLAKRAREYMDEKTRQGAPPTMGEVADFLGVQREEAALALSSTRTPVSLTESGDEETGREQAVPVPDDAIAVGDRLALQQALHSMQEKDRALILRRYFQGKTQTQTAQELGMTQVQVSRREKKILLSLRQMLL